MQEQTREQTRERIEDQENGGARGFRVGDRILQSTDTHAYWMAAHGQVGDYRLVGASAVGQSHLAKGRPRDDAFAACAFGPWLAVAVSDGVGSRPLSRYGSTFAAETLCGQLIQCVQNDTGVTRAGRGGVEFASASGDRPPLSGFDAAAASSPPARRPVQWAVMRAAPSEDRAEDNAAAPDAPPAQTALITAPAQDPAEVPVFRRPNTVSFDLAGGANAPQPLAHGTFTWQPAPAPPGSGGAEEPSGVLSEAAVRRAFQQTWNGLERFARDQEADIRSYSCTLLGLLLDTRTGRLAVGHIGDGAIVGCRRDSAPQVLVTPPSTGNPGEIYAFSRNDWQNFMSARVIEPDGGEAYTTLFLMTDGVTDACMHPPPDDILLRWTRDVDRETRQDEPAAAAARLLQWLATYRQQGSRDDRTLVVIYRASAALNGEKAPHS